MLEVFGHCWRGDCGLDLMAAAAIACLAIFSRERRICAKDRAFRIIGASTGVPTNAEATKGGPPWAELVLASGVGPEMPTDLSFQSLTDPDFLSRTGASLFVRCACARLKYASQEADRPAEPDEALADAPKEKG